MRESTRTHVFGPFRALAFLAALGLLATAAPGARADEPVAGVNLSLQKAIEEALDVNPGLNAAAESAASADHAADAVFRQHFGRVTAIALGSRYQDDQIARPMSGDLIAGGFANLPFDEDQFHYGLTFELPIFVGGRLQAGATLSRLKADEARARLGGTRWQLRANVISIYTANQALDRALLAFKDQVRALEETQQRLQLMVDTGKKPQVDLLKVVETLEEARAELASARADREHARSVLAALLDLPSDPGFILDPLPENTPQSEPDPVDWSRLLDESSEIRMARLRSDQAESGKHVARAEFLPSVAFRGNLMEHTAPSVEGPLQTWELSLAASWPLFTGGQRIAAYRSASAGQRAAELALRQTRRQLEAELNGNLSRFEADQAELAAARRRVDAGTEAARIEEVRYETGVGTVEDLLRARTRKAAAEAALAKATGDVLGTAARINALVETEVIR